MSDIPKILGVNPTDIARKLANYCVRPDADFPFNHARTLVEDAINKARPTDRHPRAPDIALTESEMAYLVLVAMDSLWEKGQSA